LQTDQLRRREFITLLGGAATWPLAARAQQPPMPLIGYLGVSSFEKSAGRSLHPGGNLTGVAYLNVEVAPKRLELLHELIPTAKSIALLVNPANPVVADAQAKELQAAISTLGLNLMLVKASNPLEMEDAFATLVRERVEALQIGVDPLFGNHVDQLVALAARHKVPTIYPWREFTAAGGLMNYGSSIPDAYRQVGVYTGQILKGAKPADLPVQRPTKLQFVLNLKTAKALGLEIPPTLLARADEVIE
jgi:putative ABC transport system substrate-binding protein